MDTSYATEPSQFGTADTQAQTQRLAEEMSAMEAVRELLFGKRVAELQSRLDQLDENFASALHRLEVQSQQRLADLDRMFREMESRMLQAISSEEIARQQEVSVLQKATHSRFTQTEKYVETLAQETARQQEAIRVDLRKAHAELSAETHHLRLSTPTLHGLAELFQQTSERLKKSYLGSDQMPAPAPRAATSNGMIGSPPPSIRQATTEPALAGLESGLPR
jgi:hypothetical protein